MDIKWADPVIQGVVIAGLIGLVGVVVAAIAGYRGAILGARIAARATTEVGEAARRESATQRVRDWNTRRIEDTRLQLVAVTDGFLALMDGDRDKAVRLISGMRDPLLANARLVGDAEALGSLAAAVVRVQRVLGGNWVLRNLRLAATNPFGPADRDAMWAARNGILSALERQQMHAILDEPLVELTADEILAIPELANADATVTRFSDSDA